MNDLRYCRASKHQTKKDYDFHTSGWLLRAERCVARCVCSYPCEFLLLLLLLLLLLVLGRLPLFSSSRFVSEILKMYQCTVLLLLCSSSSSRNLSACRQKRAEKCGKCENVFFCFDKKTTVRKPHCTGTVIYIDIKILNYTIQVYI